MGLPPSMGNTVILTVIDCFSKAARFVPFPIPPEETPLTVFDHIYKVQGLPSDLSDRGPQFVSQLWREFGQQIGATASLSSEFHPQMGMLNVSDLGTFVPYLTAHNPTSWCEQLP